MKCSKLLIITVVLISLMFAGNVLASEQGHPCQIKKGILLVAFGTSIPEAQVAFDHIGNKVKNTFPDMEIRWAYTSNIIREKLAKKGQILDSVEMALARMTDEGFTHVAVQSLHTIPGAEYDDVVKNAMAFEGMNGGIRRISIGVPLLSTQADIEKNVDAIIQNIPKERKSKEAVVLMGHGTHHPANVYYAALMFNLQKHDPNIFVGTVEGSPELEEIKEMLKEKKIKKAFLMPYMSVAGDHAMNDMAGDEEDSWKSVLTAEGITCVPILKGTAEFDNMVDIWVDHLKMAVAHLGPHCQKTK